MDIAISKLPFPSPLLFLEKWGKNGIEWKEIATPVCSVKKIIHIPYYLI